MPTRVETLAAHTEHVLDAFLRIRATYALLDPLLFDPSTKQRWGTGKRAHGFAVVVNALVYSCILDIANITLDRDRRTPSLFQLVEALEDEQLCAELRERFAVWNLQPIGSDDPEVLAILNRSERRDEARRRQEFDRLAKELRAKWRELTESNAMSSIKKMRDKLIAHRELWHDGSGYRTLDVAALGLKFNDLRSAVMDVGLLIERANLILRNASFDFTGLDDQLKSASERFWSTDSR